VADEPTTALDVSIQAQVIEVLKRMCRERSSAVLLITHDMGVIAETADRVAVMYAGRLVEVGPARRMLAQPSHPYTRGLISSIPKMRAHRGMLPQIDGSMPRLDALPPGCSFHPRCPDRLPRCSLDRPQMLTCGDGAAACWLAGPLPTGVQVEAADRE
jgi:peptide/nickel transport system ATP-binding protein